MGLGHLHKPLRHDLVFGGLFIAFRILFDFALTHELINNRPEMGSLTKGFLLFKSAMHAKFLVDWINQQRRLRRKAAKAQTKEEEAYAKVSTTAVAAPRMAIALTKAPLSVAKDLNGMMAVVDQTIQKNERYKREGQKVVDIGYDDLDTRARVVSIKGKTSSSLRSARRRITSNMKDTLDEQAFQDMAVAH